MSEAKKVIDHYGVEHQLTKLLEELGECSTEVARILLTIKEKRAISDPQICALAGEIADVQFLFEQISIGLDLDYWIATARVFKESRQRERMKEETNDE